MGYAVEIRMNPSRTGEWQMAGGKLRAIIGACVFPGKDTEIDRGIEDGDLWQAPGLPFLRTPLLFPLDPTPSRAYKLQTQACRRKNLRSHSPPAIWSISSTPFSCRHVDAAAS